jgi:uncharacterized membrane protein
LFELEQVMNSMAFPFFLDLVKSNQSMGNIIKLSRMAYCIGLAGMVAPQLYYRKFRANFLPPWPGLPWVSFWADLFSILVIAACVAIVLEIKGRRAALILGGLLLAMMMLGGIPYVLIIDPNSNHLFAWGDLLTETALTGGAFVVSGSFTEETIVKRSSGIRLLEKSMPLGRLLFSICLIGYGLFHFLYTDSVAKLIPTWMPFPVFWTYLAAVALIVGGMAIVLHLKLKLTGILIAILIFIFLIVVHIPLAITDPLSNEAFQVVRIFGAVAFIGTAFLIAFVTAPKR